MEMLKTIFIFSNRSGCHTIFLLLYFINRDVYMETGFLKVLCVVFFFFLKRASVPTADSTPEVIILYDTVIGGSGNDFDVT